MLLLKSLNWIMNCAICRPGLVCENGDILMQTLNVNNFYWFALHQMSMLEIISRPQKSVIALNLSIRSCTAHLDSWPPSSWGTSPPPRSGWGASRSCRARGCTCRARRPSSSCPPAWCPGSSWAAGSPSGCRTAPTRSNSKEKYDKCCD